MSSKHRNISFIIIITLIILYMAAECLGMARFFASGTDYIIRPLFWVLLFLLVFFLFKKDKLLSLKNKKEVIMYVVIFIISYFTIYFSLGYLIGFGYNPYNRSLAGLLLNFWSLIPALFAKEYIRNYMVKNSDNKKTWVLILIALLFTLPELNVLQIGTYFSGTTGFFNFLFEYLIPVFATSFFLTYISSLSNCIITFAFRAFPVLLKLILPILPDINWLLMSMIDTTFAFLGFVIIKYRVGYLNKENDNSDYKVYSVKNWLIPLGILAIFMVFALGYMPIRPVVIATDSMYPKIEKGDIVLISNIDMDDIEVGNIIQYRMDNYTIIHRVEEIGTNNQGEKYLVMKGDNNNTVDLLPVKEDQISGIVKLRVPYLGYPTLLVNQLIGGNMEDSVQVETGRK